VTNSVDLPNDAITDAMVVDSITASNYVLKTGDSMSGELSVIVNSTDSAITATQNNTTSSAPVISASTNGSNVAIQGSSIENNGVNGASTDFNGVYGTSTNNYGVRGVSTNEAGILGFTSTGSYGVVGISYNNHGIRGESTAVGAAGVYGYHLQGYGVKGDAYDSNYSGVYGINNAGGPGVYGKTALGSATYGVIGCYGASFNCGYLGGEAYAGYFSGGVRATGSLQINGQIISGGNITINGNKGLTLKDELTNGYCLKMYSTIAVAPATAVKIFGPGTSVLAIIPGVCP